MPLSDRSGVAATANGWTLRQYLSATEFGELFLTGLGEPEFSPVGVFPPLLVDEWDNDC